ncbi:hypothetical protein E1162_15695 [Rhodobacteraceae bacterium RKSG542]|uniref:ceramidase domain-containing protein n=1 Tax=Pseudovibrio flavus TaxID=2529854 RepID=UPI0012BBD4F8|nr:ceramidase domain-containing protein [Pseudovibrio flavus]MTI18688.1 hypothetical protein [Pseudovibrio flavus]
MDLMAQVNHYCERTNAAFWSEPLNAITNLAFIIAAFALFLLWRKQESRDWAPLLLMAIIAIIGIGSFLFHTYATIWAMLSDTIPITIFMLVYFYFAFTRFLHVKWYWGLVGVLVFFAFLSSGPMLFGAYVGSSAGYVPALLAIFAFALITSFTQRNVSPAFLLAGIVFTISLFLRTMDTQICASLPIGTHFLWHMLNAVVLYVLTRALILYHVHAERKLTSSSAQQRAG